MRLCKKATNHGFRRFRQRYEPGGRTREIVKYAYECGICANQLQDGLALKKYLKNKEAFRHKKVKVHDGYVFIFFTTSKRLITMYPLPAEYLEEYKKAKKELR